jgi:hypothetical protein
MENQLAARSTLLSGFIPPYDSPYKCLPVHKVIAAGEPGELCYLPGKDRGADPEYWLIDETGLKVVLGKTGMVRAVERKKGQTSEILAHRNNAYGNFFDGRHQPSDPSVLEGLIDSAYERISGLDFNEDLLRELFGWSFARLRARFSDYESLYGRNDIIPEYTDSMNMIKVSTGCYGKCIGCSEPNGSGMVPSDEQAIKENIRLSRVLQGIYHGDFKRIMDEGFINSADLLRFHLEGWTDPVQITGWFREAFPELTKIYSFMSVSSINRTDANYLTGLYNSGKGVNRALVGIEIVHDKLSRFWGKSETREEKRGALLKLRAAGFKVKPIVQIGFSGEGIYGPGGEFVSTMEALEETAEFMAEFISGSNPKRPDKLLISKYTLIEGTPLMELFKAGRKIKPYSIPDGAEKDIALFVGLLKKRGVDVYSSVELDYESALEGRRRILA